MINTITATTFVKFGNKDTQEITTVSPKIELDVEDPATYLDDKGEMTDLGLAAHLSVALMGVIAIHRELVKRGKADAEGLIEAVCKHLIALQNPEAFETDEEGE